MPKVSTFIVIAGLIFFVGCNGQKKITPTEVAVTKPSGADTKPPAASEEKDAIKVEIENDKMTINGIAIPSKPEIAVVEKALGKPSGNSGSGVMNAIFWKDHGIKCLQDKSTKKIAEIGFYFDGYYDSETSSSSKPFKGSIVVNGQKVTNATKIAELSKKLNLVEGNALIYENQGHRTTIIFKVPTDTITEVSVSR